MESFDFLREIWQAAEKAGPFGTALALYLYFRESAKHESTRNKLDTIQKLYGDRANIGMDLLGRLLEQTNNRQERR